MVVIVFWDFSIFYQIFVLPQVKRGVIISSKNDVYESHHDLHKF